MLSLSLALEGRKSHTSQSLKRSDVVLLSPYKQKAIELIIVRLDNAAAADGDLEQITEKVTSIIGSGFRKKILLKKPLKISMADNGNFYQIRGIYRTRRTSSCLEASSHHL